jgi:PTS system nitrogen regulatory IIA component
VHLGATIRLLRIDAGLSLRHLAHRIGVSSAYLSRVENGLDAVPTPERLIAISGELGIPPTLLMDVANRQSPFVASYLDEVPAARGLLTEIARRGLSPAELERVLAFLNAEFPVRAAMPRVHEERLADLLDPDRLVLQLECSEVTDAVDVAVQRLCRAQPGLSLAEVRRGVDAREATASTSLGNGVAVPHAVLAGAVPAAALITLRTPIVPQTPDQLPVRVIVVMVDVPGSGSLCRLAHVARLARRGLAERVAPQATAEGVFAALRALEALG